MLERGFGLRTLVLPLLAAGRFPHTGEHPSHMLAVGAEGPRGHAEARPTPAPRAHSVSGPSPSLSRELRFLNKTEWMCLTWVFNAFGK